MTTPGGLTLPLRPLRLYRHLLREASYLPPVCRAQVEPRIRHRFRKHRHDPAPAKRLLRANRDLRYLQAANFGDMARMRRIVLLTFGRIGWRRQELMTELLRLEQPGSAAELESHLQETRPVEDWLDRWDAAKLLAFAKSQGQHKPHNSPRPQVHPRRLDPAQAVPPLNVWGRPLSTKTARIKERKWWKSLANRILPPVPQGEWELLRQLATGQAGAEWRVPARRGVTQSSAAAADGEWEWERYATRPIRTVERRRSRRLRVLFGQKKPDGPYDGPAIGIHRYTPRFWRRLYGEVWQMTAVVERRPDREGTGWNVTWGGLRRPPLAPSATSHEFFEGVDSNGAVFGQTVDTQKQRQKSG